MKPNRSLIRLFRRPEHHKPEWEAHTDNDNYSVVKLTHPSLPYAILSMFYCPDKCWLFIEINCCQVLRQVKQGEAETCWICGRVLMDLTAIHTARDLFLLLLDDRLDPPEEEIWLGDAMTVVDRVHRGWARWRRNERTTDGDTHADPTVYLNALIARAEET